MQQINFLLKNTLLILGGVIVFFFSFSFAYAAAPTASITSTPSVVTLSGSGDYRYIQLTWSSTNATSCTGTNFSTGNSTSGSAVVSINTTTTYTVRCTGSGGTATASKTVYVATYTPVTGSCTWTSGGGGQSDPGCISCVFSGCFPFTCEIALVPNTTSISPGESAILSWSGYSLSNQSFPTYISNYGPVSPFYGGNVSVSPSQTTTYQAYCTYEGLIGTGSAYSDPVTITVTNSAPARPTISGPTTGETSTNYVYTFRASDPDGDKVRYRVDWDYDGGVDQTSSWVNSNTAWNATYSWPTAGTYTFRGRTQDYNLAYSSWRTYTVEISDPTPACSNGIDDDGDGRIDTADYGCSSASDTSESPNPQCSDGADNDGDGRTDYGYDYGCTSYADTSESPNPQCSDGIDNNDNGKTDYPDDPACTSYTDGNEQVQPDAALSLSANPSLTRSGTSVSLEWSATNADTCSLAGTNGDSWSLSGSSGTKTSSALTAETIFTLSCTDLNGDPVSTATTVRLIPSFEEI